MSLLDQIPFTQVLPFITQRSSHPQLPPSQLQVAGWQVVGSGSATHEKPEGQLVAVQLTGLGTPPQVPAAGAPVVQIPCWQLTMMSGQGRWQGAATTQQPSCAADSFWSYAAIAEAAMAAFGHEHGSLQESPV